MPLHNKLFKTDAKQLASFVPRILANNLSPLNRALCGWCKGILMKQSEKQLYRATDEILYYLWDPIGVNDCPAARDEYQSYLPKTFKLLVSDAKDHEIAAYLNKVESSSMGLGANKPHALNIAKLLKEAREFYFD